MRPFFLIFFSVYFGTTSFVILHLMDVLKPFKIKFLFLAIYIFLGFGVFLGRIWGNHFPLDVSVWFARVGYIWMGLLTYMFVWSVIWLVLRLFGLGPTTESHRLMFYFGEMALCLIILWIGYTNAHNVRIITHNIHTEKDINMKVVQISDNHLGFMNSEKRFSRIVDKIREIEPDILLITGDFLENEHNFAIQKGIGESLKSLEIPKGKWAVLGNHEYISGIEKSINYMESLGIKILRDSSELIDDRLLLIGQDDSSKQRWSNEPPLSLEEILVTSYKLQVTSCKLQDTRNSPPSPSYEMENGQWIMDNYPLSIIHYQLHKEGADRAFTILMTHQIKDHKEYENRDIDLVLSGHTHFGQIFPFNLITKKMFDIAYGLQKRGNTYIYVSSGTGIWGFPMRIGTKSEIVVFEIGELF